MKILQRSVPENVEFTLELHPVLKRIYAARGLTRDGEITLPLAELENPFQLKNIDRAVAMLLDALDRRDDIVIVGDFDADGATSCALGLLCLRAMGFHSIEYLVPNRFEYGYGLTPEIVELARERHDPDMIITVDNGIASHEGVARAHELAMKVLVTDHHLPGETLPGADCILNPNLPGCAFPSKHLAGVGVMFYLLTALRAALRRRDWFRSQGIDEPNMAEYLDLVALGTVADVVPLDVNNRRLVKHGLRVIRGGHGRPGIRALLEAAGRDCRMAVAADLGFAAAPRLNAAGRLDDMSLGIECLMAQEEDRARGLARRLNELNMDRKNIEQSMQEQALDALRKLDGHTEDASRLGICLYDPDWHQGVVGILASRMKDRFHRPAIAFADAGVDESGEAWIKGSARSLAGLHMRDLLARIASRHPRLLNKFGGHAMAAGLSILKRDFESFAGAYEAALAETVTGDMLEARTWTDGPLPGACLDLDFANQLREAGPWGQKFPEPLFTGEFEVVDQRLLGERHRKLVLQVPGSDSLIDALAFNSVKHAEERKPRRVHLVYRLDVNEYRGTRTPQLIIEQMEILA